MHAERTTYRVITGASRGIGRGIALELARLGYGVAINYVRRREAAEECAALCRKAAPPDSPARFEPIQADISALMTRLACSSLSPAASLD